MTHLLNKVYVCWCWGHEIIVDHYGIYIERCKRWPLTRYCNLLIIQALELDVESLFVWKSVDNGAEDYKVLVWGSFSFDSFVRRKFSIHNHAMITFIWAYFQQQSILHVFLRNVIHILFTTQTPGKTLIAWVILKIEDSNNAVGWK